MSKTTLKLAVQFLGAAVIIGISAISLSGCGAEDAAGAVEPCIVVYDEPCAVEETVADIPAVEDDFLIIPTEEESDSALAKLVYGEARNLSVTEQAAVIWCVLNRVDAGYGDVIECITEDGAFAGYSPDNPVDADILALVHDVQIRWVNEMCLVGSSGRVLPREYLWFSGDGQHNYFRNAYDGGSVWDWSLESPYD